ncbi:Fur family transcriptional regulator [Pseudomonadota bacterium]
MSVVSAFQSPKHNHARCMQGAINTAADLCTQRGVRLTPLRQRVLELIWRGHEPVLAYDLLEQLRSEHRAAAPPTVYRALDFLLEQGLIHRIQSLKAFVACGDPTLSPHSSQFLICTQCNAIAELADREIGRLVARKATASGFTVHNQTIEIRGLCPRCEQA